jgi:hypothetical protein
VIEFGGCPADTRWAVAAKAVNCRRDMCTRLAPGRAAVVTSPAVGGCCKGAMVGFRSRPNGSRLVAAFAHRHAVVNRCRRLANRRREAAAMAASAPGAHRHIGM